MVHGHLHRRVSRHEVAANDVSLGSGDQNDPISIPQDSIVLDHVVIRASSGKPDAEVAPLSCVTIGAGPVRTEPVAACAARQSYTPTGETEIPISY